MISPSVEHQSEQVFLIFAKTAWVVLLECLKVLAFLCFQINQRARIARVCAVLEPARVIVRKGCHVSTICIELLNDVIMVVLVEVDFGVMLWL